MAEQQHRSLYSLARPAAKLELVDPFSDNLERPLVIVDQAAFGPVDNRTPSTCGHPYRRCSRPSGTLYDLGCATCCAVVPHKDDDRVVGDPDLVQFSTDLADILVDEFRGLIKPHVGAAMVLESLGLTVALVHPLK